MVEQLVKEIGAGNYNMLVSVPNYLLVIGAFFIWLACVFLGIIARRYQLVLGETTNWQFMMIAPTGILVFTVIQLYYCGVLGRMMLPKGGVTWIAYGFFLLSGILSFVSNMRFYSVTRRGS